MTDIQTEAFQLVRNGKASEVAKIIEERDKLKRVLAREVTENDELGAEFVLVTAVKDENRKLKVMCIDLANALRLRTLHDEDCADQNEEFEENESCECGAVVAQRAVEAFDKMVLV